MAGSSRLPLFIIISLFIHIAIIILFRGIQIEHAKPRTVSVPVLMVIAAVPAAQEMNMEAPKFLQTETVRPSQAVPEEEASAEAVDDSRPKPVPLPTDVSITREEVASGSDAPAEAADAQPEENSGAAGASQATTDSNTGPIVNPFAGLMRIIDDAKASSYPLIARKKGFEGRVVVQISLDAGGNLVDVKLLEGCRYGVLNEAALELIRTVLSSPYPHNTDSDVVLKLPLTYRLR